MSESQNIVLKNMPENFSSIIEELSDAFDEIQQPRTDFILQHFVVGQHDTLSQQYAQCVLELQIKYDDIRRANLLKRKLNIEIAELEAKQDVVSQIDADLKRIDLEQQDRAFLGASREFTALYRLWKSFGRTFTRTELNAAQEEYWKKRLTRQANQDLIASGRVSQGSQEALKQIGSSVFPELDHVRDVEQRYLETGDTKILLVVPTIEKAVGGLPCITNVNLPAGAQVKIFNVWGRSTANAYNEAAMTALKDQADFMLTVEDDTFPQTDAFCRLLDKYRMCEEKTIIGGWYPKRMEYREGAAIVLKDNKRLALEDDGGTHEVYTIPMGFTLFPTKAFLETDFPWFVTTEHLTQDSFFSQKAREAGYKLLVDTSIKCKHIDPVSGIVYE